MTLNSFSGVSSATFSISTPPSVEAMITTRRVALSTTAPRYNSCAISQVSSINNGPEKTSLASILFASPEEDGSNKFDDYVKMESKFDAGAKFNFEFLEDPKASRYVMEMGDGVRLIVTQKNLQYQYAEPGKYVIELKELKSGLLQLIGTKSIKVK